MYQRKIKQWGLEKKRKMPEMCAILRLARLRDANGQASVFRVRGRRVDLEEVYRYFGRRGEDPRTLDLRRGFPIPPTVTVHTPPPERARAVDKVHDEDPVELFFPPAPYPASSHTYSSPGSDYISAIATSSSSSSLQSDSVVSTPVVIPGGNFSSQFIPNYPHLGMPIDLSFDDQCIRYVLSRAQCYFDAIVPAQFYSTEGSSAILAQPWRRTFSSWSLATSEGQELIKTGQVETLRILREQAHASVRKHITNNSPIILLRYFEIIHALRSSGDFRDGAYLQATLRYCLSMAETVLWPGHPIRDLTRLLLRPDVNPIMTHLVQQGIQKSLQILFERCGLAHPRILYVLESRTQTLLDENQFEKATTEANLYLSRAEYLRGNNSFEACQALRMLGDVFLGQDLYDEAAQMYERAFDMQRHLPSLQDRGAIGVKTQRGLAVVAKRRARFSEANAHLHIALQMAKDMFGDDDALVGLVQCELVKSDLEALHEDVRRWRGELAYRPLDS
jgi:tetratricopeptide (TPR) repeat protein